MNSNIKLNSSELLMLKVCKGEINKRTLISKLLDMGVFKSFGHGKNLIVRLKNKNLIEVNKGKVSKTIEGIKITNKYV